ncbi:hypothetical protein ASPZODRAFT_138911 [Penicilliopsis zonata CBS 506.65]|uniref:Uncharacterized protein n=1 Tax=Penicilliopsis zonata CBS 506.65 TaxID=1073090 RepID=A0A1L9SQY3_9EURO|nr:hypothetical protein ASPZODRAFT_138911 [Penicilliopsis zonata CBS 506.65]OJJ49517.1 hypothetical protein ASPZODRAFT_138911 [Penicilliopsis zonata CBS 506.65]
MTNSGSYMNRGGFREALDRARESEDGQIDAATSEILENALKEVWRKLERDRDHYIFTRDEFALFNFFRDRYRGNPIAQNAVARYWDNLQQRETSNSDGSRK